MPALQMRTARCTRPADGHRSTRMLDRRKACETARSGKNKLLHAPPPRQLAPLMQECLGLSSSAVLGRKSVVLAARHPISPSSQTSLQVTK